VIAYRSRDYHDGTGSRVFLTKNPVCYILTLDLQYERQTVAHLQQEILTLQDERIQWHQERAKLTEQLFAREHAHEMTQVQLAYTEAQHFALVQDVMEMQNQVVEMEIEVEVW
jgi:hypothetical protein